MSEKVHRNLWSVVILSLALVGAMLLSGGRQEAQASAKQPPSPASVSRGAQIVPGVAHADTDVLDLQLD